MKRMFIVVLFVSFAASALAVYNPQTGRWLSRDPSGERGGKNLYQFAANSAIGHIDTLGRQAVPTQPTPSPKPLPPDPPVTPPAGLPDDGWNCAGCAFRDYNNRDLAWVKQRLSKCRKLSSCADQCKAGECKFWLWEYTSKYTAYMDQSGTQEKAPPGIPADMPSNPYRMENDFHVVGGNVDPKTGEDTKNVPSKMGASPCSCRSNETDFGKNWKPTAAEEVHRWKDRLMIEDKPADLVLKVERENLKESCYCCPHMD